MTYEIADNGSVTLFGYEDEHLGRLDEQLECSVKGFPLRPECRGEILNETPDVVRIGCSGESNGEVGHLDTPPARHIHRRAMAAPGPSRYN